MHFTSLLLLATAALCSAIADPNPADNLKAEAFNELAEINGQLSRAILVGRSILANPHAAHDPEAKRAAAHLTAAFDAAEHKRDLQRRGKWCGWVGEGCGKVRRSAEAVSEAAPVEKRGKWCGWVGEGCGKVRRSAEAVSEILGAPELQKRVAGKWCGWVGEGCGKAKRSMDQLLSASNEILAAYPQ